MGKTKRKLRIFIEIGIFAIFLSAILLLAGCGRTELQRPNGLYVDDISQYLTLNWNSVQDASKYEVDFNGDRVEVRRNTYIMDELEPATYTIRVRALGDDLLYSDSEWSEPITYTKEADSGLRYRLIENYTAYEVAGLGTAEGDIVVDDTYRGKPVVRIAESAFTGSTKITSIVLGKNVTTIAKRAFTNCGTLESITIPEGLTSIGDYAFQRCIALKSVVLPDSLTSISNYCFSSCKALEEVTLGNNVQSIGTYAFSNCEALKSFEMPDTVSSLGEYTLYACSSLESVRIGDRLTSIPEHAFDGCESLVSVSIPSKVTTLGDYAFARCSKLESIDIPNVTGIGVSAFSEASALTDVSLGEGLVSIGQDAFWETGLWQAAELFVYADDWLVGCKQTSFPEEDTFSITAETLAAGVAGIADYVFCGIQGIYRVEIPDTVRQIGRYSFYGIETLMSVVIGNGVECIQTAAFDSCTMLSDLTIGENVTEIQTYAFARCTKLKNDVELPDKLEKIGTYAFYATGLWRASDLVVYVDNWVVGIRFPKMFPVELCVLSEDTVGICDYAFYNAIGYQHIQLNEGLKYIGRSAFYNCLSLQEIAIPSTVSVIEDYAFYNCIALTSATFAGDTVSLGRAAFYNCVSLTSVSLPSGMRTVGDYAFYGCTGLTSVDLGRAWSIGEGAFYGCTKLEYVKIPDTMTTIGAHAFNGCVSLSFVTVGRNLHSVPEYAFANCTALTEINVSGSVVDIGHHAFFRCTSLKEAFLADGIQTIGKYAFYGCTALEYVRLSSTLKEIADYAFKGDGSLVSVTIGSSVAKMGIYVFYGCDLLTVYCEAEALPSGWNALWNASFRPVIWECTVWEGAVVDFSGDPSAIENGITVSGISAPYKPGYTFVGWSTTSSGEGDISYEEIFGASDGGKLYAVWLEEEN